MAVLLVQILRDGAGRMEARFVCWFGFPPQSPGSLLHENWCDEDQRSKLLGQRRLGERAPPSTATRLHALPPSLPLLRLSPRRALHEAWTPPPEQPTSVLLALLSLEERLLAWQLCER